MIRKPLPLIGIASLALAGSAVSLHAAAAPEDSSAQISSNHAAPSKQAARCVRLTGKQLAGASVERAEFIAKGTKLAPFDDALTFAFCRVDARISPAPGSEIKMQVWLPQQWNGNFAGVGGGGFNGGLASASLGLRKPASEGYAAVATDAGHDVSAEAEWALGNPEKVVDFGHRANHMGAVVGKAIVAAYYGTPARQAYFHGCSNGGRDALMLAQRYPKDYDAIAVGAPANDFTGLLTAFVHNERTVRRPGIDLSPSKLSLVHDASVKMCDARDGATDGLIERPSMCRFDPAVLQCKSKDGGSCLTNAEVAAVKSIYRGTYTSDGTQVMAGFPVGSEYEWSGWITSPKAMAPALGVQLFQYMVHGDPAWDVSRFDLDRDYVLARAKVGSIIDALDPDLRPFLGNGGKLLMYHGWDDAAIPAGNTLQYYDDLRRTIGNQHADAVRLFMMPGVAHCAGGRGPDAMDVFGELDRWTKSGVAPERITATKLDSLFRGMAGLPAKVLATRPVCAWPKSAHYKGTGSVSDAASFVCK